MRTQVLPSDPSAVKAWATKVALDTRKKTFFNAMTGEEGSSMPVIRKTDLETGPGDQVTTSLIAKIRAKPIEGQEKLAGRAQKLNSFTHKMLIDKHRQAINVGDVMDQKRTKWNIADQARDRLSDYLAEIYDEQVTMTASGGRGIGNEVQHYPLGYLGFPNAFVAPDSQHVVYFDGSRANPAAITAADKLGTNVLDKLIVKAKRQIGGQPDQAVKMVPIDTEGQKCFIYLTGPEGLYDLRREVGEAGWLAVEKAKATAVGAKSPIFQGGSALYNGCIVDETQTIVKWDTTSAGGSYGAQAMRSLFLGANAVAVAHGTKSQKDGMRYELTEDDEDYGEEGIIIVRMIAGFSKPRYQGMDFGVIANDISFTSAP